MHSFNSAALDCVETLPSLRSPHTRYSGWHKQSHIYTGAYLAGLQGLPVLIISNQPKPRYLVVLVIGNHQVIGAGGNDVIVVPPSACARSRYSSLQMQSWPFA